MVVSAQHFRAIKNKLDPLFEGALKAVSLVSGVLMLIGLFMIYLYLKDNEVTKYFWRFLSQTNLLLMIAVNSLLIAASLLAMYFYLPFSLSSMKDADCFSWKRKSPSLEFMHNATYVWIPMVIITIILWFNIKGIEWTFMWVAMAALNACIYYAHRQGPDVDSGWEKIKHLFLLFIMMLIFCVTLLISFSFIVKMFSSKIVGDAYQWGALFAFVVVYGLIVGYVAHTKELKTIFWIAIVFSLALLAFIRGEWSATAFSELRLGAYKTSYLVDKQVDKLLPNRGEYSIRPLENEPYIILSDVWVVLSVDDFVVIKSDKISPIPYHIPARFFIDEMPSGSDINKQKK